MQVCIYVARRFKYLFNYLLEIYTYTNKQITWYTHKQITWQKLYYVYMLKIPITCDTISSFI